MKYILINMLRFVEFYISIRGKTLTKGSCPKHSALLRDSFGNLDVDYYDVATKTFLHLDCLGLFVVLRRKAGKDWR